MVPVYIMQIIAADFTVCRLMRK